MISGLVIMFNHKYNKNLHLLRDMYSNRFSYIRFLVPFYQGNDSDVISVYENSYQFQGYVAQGLHEFLADNISHYIFVGDDLILNPILNEMNVAAYFGLKEADSYFESFTPLKDMKSWPYERFRGAELAFKQKGASFWSEIPSKEKAFAIANKYEMRDFDLKNVMFLPQKGAKQIANILKSKIKPISIDYPLVTGYSDFFIVSAKDVIGFSHVCGTFAAMRLWVEIAIPTALMLTAGKIVAQKDIKLKTEKMWLPSEFVKKFEEKCQYRISMIQNNWPEGYAYLHPVKLSKWKR